MLLVTQILNLFLKNSFICIKYQVRCKLTGHELPVRLSDLENYAKGKKYQRMIKDIPNEIAGFEEYKEFIVPSEKNGKRLFCKLTKKFINNTPHQIQKHVTGRRFITALEKHREIQNTESEKSGEDMWVPSDLESGSQEEEGSTKMEEDQGDSGGEFVSEEEKDSYKRNDNHGVKRTSNTKKEAMKKSNKKLRTGDGRESKKDKGSKRRKTKC